MRIPSIHRRAILPWYLREGKVSFQDCPILADVKVETPTEVMDAVLHAAPRLGSKLAAWVFEYNRGLGIKVEKFIRRRSQQEDCIVRRQKNPKTITLQTE